MTRVGRLCAAAVACFNAAAAAFPNAPFKAVGSSIQDSTGQNFTYVGVNWSGHGEVMIPEGLQYQPISAIAEKIKSLDFNVVRLTFAIEMVDNILDNGLDVTLQSAFQNALGEENGTKVLDAVLEKNPQFKPETTRLEVFDAVADELAKHELYVHLDNHVSKAMWCCNQTDGNAWFSDKYFDVEKWKRGLGYMAEHGKDWASLVSVGLRNELREAIENPDAQEYSWSTWYNNTIPAGDAVNSANPDLLIFYSGLDYDTDLSPIPDAEDLGNELKFELDRSAYADKMILELHTYDVNATDCKNLTDKLWNNGFKAMDQVGENIMPVVLTEFGYNQEDDSYDSVYASCLREWIPQNSAGWMVWVLGGSYYTRQETQDYDDTWGLLNHDWSAWRSQEAIDGGIAVMIKNTLG